MEILFAKTEHIDEITKIEKVFRHLAFSRRQIKRQIENSNVMIVKDDFEILGYVFVNRTGKNSGWVTNIAVIKKARKKGLGRELLKFGKAYLEMKGCNKISLHVRATNKPAIKLYESEGFVKKKRIPKLFRPTDGFLMVNVAYQEAGGETV
jgi:ribosomal-protein-alanine N-acetyltransferase